MTRPAKKSETLEVRLPYAAKEAFMARCRAEGLTASEAVRSFIEAEIEGRTARRRSKLIGRIAAGALLAAAAAGVATAPVLAHPLGACVVAR